jgi:hypothetical protein
MSNPRGIMGGKGRTERAAPIVCGVSNCQFKARDPSELNLHREIRHKALPAPVPTSPPALHTVPPPPPAPRVEPMPLPVAAKPGMLDEELQRRLTEILGSAVENLQNRLAACGASEEKGAELLAQAVVHTSLAVVFKPLLDDPKSAALKDLVRALSRDLRKRFE